MAKKNNTNSTPPNGDGRWITISGRKVWWPNGKTIREAMRDSNKFDMKPKYKPHFITPKKELTLDDLEQIDIKYPDNSTDKEARVKAALAYYKSLGYTGVPTEITEKEYNDIKTGMMARGLTNGDIPASDILEKFYTGDAHAMQGIYGTGEFFWRMENEVDTLMAASVYGDIKISDVKLAIDANVVDYKELNKIKSANIETLSKQYAGMSIDTVDKYYSKQSQVMSDNGVYAASLGYDAISTSDNTLVVLNRTKVVYVKKDK